MKNLLVIAVLFVVLISTTNAQTQSDKSDMVWTIVLPKAACQDIDMNKCLLGDSKDSVIDGVIRNTGAWKCRIDSIYFRGADAAAFGLVSGIPVYTIPVGEDHAGEFHFVPSRIGIHTAELVVITQSDTLIKRITGEGVKPQLEIVNSLIDFGVVNVGNNRDTLKAVTIKNIGSTLLSITGTNHTKPNDVDFTTLAGGGSFILNPGEVCKMDLRFAPSSPGRTSGLLEFHYNGLGSPAIVQLYGEGLEQKPIILVDADIFQDIVCVSVAETKVKISNKGGLTLLINEINKIGGDANQFIVNETLPITIEKDSTKFISVQFKPTSVGTKSIDLEIKSNAEPDSVLIIPVTAHKDTVSIVPERYTYNIGYLCGNQIKDTVLNILNLGTLKSGAYLTANPNLTYSKDNVSLDLGESVPITISYTGAINHGPFTENISIVDSICGYIQVVQLIGEIVNQDLIAETIDVGYVCPNTKIDTVLKIDNVGKLKFYGKLVPSSIITLAKDKFILNPSESDNISISINPLVAQGQFTGNITITDSICGYTKIITITGFVQKPDLSAPDITVACMVGQTNDGILAIENKSDIAVVIQNAPIVSAPFSIVGNPFPLTIPAKEIKNITLRYTPTDNSLQSNILQFLVEPCGVTYETKVSGVPSYANALIETDTLSAYPGDTLNIPIVLKNEDGLAMAGVNSISTDLLFNPTLLTPLDRIAYPVKSINTKQARIEIKNIPISLKTGDKLMEIPFIVGLGNEEICPLILENMVPNGGPANIQGQDGSFKLLGICREGGTRLFLPTGKVEILAIIPNPVSENVEINVNLIEKGKTTLSVINPSGQKVIEFDMTGGIGLKSVNVDVREFGNGMYFVQLQTPTVLLNRKLMIIR
jgi:hypothetical protein